MRLLALFITFLSWLAFGTDASTGITCLIGFLYLTQLGIALGKFCA